MELELRAARDHAADLTRWFLDGRITNRELERRWPVIEDHALEAVGYFLSLLSDLRREHPIRPEDAGNIEVRGQLRRCVAFLRSDLPYAWPHRGMTRQPSMANAEMLAAGDIRLWPFIRREDYDLTGLTPSRRAWAWSDWPVG
jgi:hypothetical protein